MPPFERHDLTQRALIWRKTGVDSYGEGTYGDPEEIVVRWNDKRIQAPNPQTETVGATATVITSTALSVGDLLWKGWLIDLVGTSLAPPSSGVIRVLQDVSTPDIKGRNTRLEYQCERYNSPY